MDILEATNDFQDWELLQTSSDFESPPVSALDSGNSLDEIDSGGLIQANYFSLDAQDRFAEGVDDDKSAESDNPSWIDPGLEEDPNRYLNKESGEFWSDSSSERSEDRRVNELEGGIGMGAPEKGKIEMKFEGIGDLREGKGKEATGIEFDGGSGEVGEFVENSQVGVEGNVNLSVESEALGGEKNGNEMTGSGGGGGVAEDGVANGNSGEVEKRGLVWWKMPMEFLKYCMLRMSPVWTVSVAAAFMGFVILGRRLYKMKKKARGLQIKVTVDDKKVSQVMSRAARLNEAFSVVRRVPVIRPSLPAVGSNTTWPAMSMR